MTVGAALLVYAAVLGGLGSAIYRHDGWLIRAPRLGATLLLAAAWSVLLAAFLAGLTLALPGTALSDGLSHLLGACILRLRAAYVTPGGAAAAGAGLTLSAAIVLRSGWALLQVGRVRRAELRRQRLLVALCGRRESARGAVIVDQPQPVAYCVAGRSNTVVLTSGAVELLTPAQLSAVLAHEHAHLRAKHHRLQACAAFAARTLPESAFMREIPHHIGRLLEMHADDLAARTQNPEELAAALVAVATARPASPPSSEPSALLSAADRDVVQRVRRLLLPPANLSPRRQRAVRAAVVMFGLFPLLVALTPAAVAANQPPVRKSQVVSAVHRAQ